jgi:protein-serine/threonine kinase
MDQLRNVPFKRPPQAYPWDPLRGQTQPSNVVEEDYFSSASTTATPNSDTGETTPTARTGAVPGSSVVILSPETRPLTEGNLSSLVGGDVNPLEWHAKISAETVKNRGHPNICKMLDFFEDREFYYRECLLVYLYLGRGIICWYYGFYGSLVVMPRFGVGLDLFDRVESAPDGLPAFEIRSLLGQLSDALRFLHANGVVHRDIKDENVVLDGQGHCQLIDFGSAAHWRPGRKWDTFSGTLDYASPEILRGEMYSGKEQDVWALGVVGYVLICGETPFLSADEAQAGLGVDSKPYAALMRRCSGPRGQEGLEADGGGKMKHAYDFVQRCLEMKPEDRPPAEALVKHRFVLGQGGWVGHRNWIQEGQAWQGV